MENFGKILIFLIILLKTLIVGTCKYRLAEVVLTSTHNVCFGSKIKKIGIPQFYYIKVGYKGVFIAWTCFHDEFKDYGSVLFFQKDAKILVHVLPR